MYCYRHEDVPLNVNKTKIFLNLKIYTCNVNPLFQLLLLTVMVQEPTFGVVLKKTR